MMNSTQYSNRFFEFCASPIVIFTFQSQSRVPGTTSRLTNSSKCVLRKEKLQQFRIDIIHRRIYRRVLVVVYVYGFVCLVVNCVIRQGLGILRLLETLRIHSYLKVLDDPEVTANLFINFAYLYWEGCAICSIYFW